MSIPARPDQDSASVLAVSESVNVSASLIESSTASRGAQLFWLDRTLFVAGLLQVVAAFTPAARVRVIGPLPFVRLPTAGVALVILGLCNVGVALRPRGWWRWLPSIASALVLALVYWRLHRNPSHTFVDPVLRHLLHPSWGFVPMGLAVLLGLIGAARIRNWSVGACAD
jgi:hypothetical protein